MTELLAPAGNGECAETAINAGANAIYLGFSSFSARASAENFTFDELKRIIDKAHFSSVKVYVAMNTLVKNAELNGFFDVLLQVWSLGADAIIVQDLFLGKYIHEKFPEIVLHLSTQAGVCSVSGAKQAKEFGFSRVILARETPLDEIKKITEIVETEAFIQGALCSSFSGQCYFSSFVGGNSGNRGRCKQPCRKQYGINRDKYGEQAYTLSLSDLCVGERIFQLKDAGVSSFKIEGRMRRKEYIASALSYYRKILYGATENEKNDALSVLKRAYNRGNYTTGLAFGQDKRFLSRKVQGHLGEKVGVVKVVKGEFFVETKEKFQKGDAFKILRDGKEVCGADFEKADVRGFYLSKSTRLKAGDNVFVTTDTKSFDKVLSEERKEKIGIDVDFTLGKQAVVSCSGTEVRSEEVLERAENSPLTQDEILKCFQKTDGLPVEIYIKSCKIDRVFMPKSRLNALRRAFFDRIFAQKTANSRQKYTDFALKIPVFERISCQKHAVIASNFDTFQGNYIAVYKPDDYFSGLQTGIENLPNEKFLYFPSLCTSVLENRILSLINEGKFDGIYGENYSALYFAKAHGVKLFAGTGFNLTNSVSVNELKKFDVLAYYAISKELSTFEQADLVSANAFVLSCGEIKLMDLCYCPFEKNCSTCDKKRVYTLTDENGREFYLRRYNAETGCRYEVYNCASLYGKGVENAGKIVDLSLGRNGELLLALDDEQTQKNVLKEYTTGHRKNGVQ